MPLKHMSIPHTERPSRSIYLCRLIDPLHAAFACTHMHACARSQSILRMQSNANTAHSSLPMHLPPALPRWGCFPKPHHARTTMRNDVSEVLPLVTPWASTILSPDEMRPKFLPYWMAVMKRSSSLSAASRSSSGHRYGTHPRCRLHAAPTCESLASTRIGQRGRCFEMRRAEVPVAVSVMITAALEHVAASTMAVHGMNGRTKRE